MIDHLPGLEMGIRDRQDLDQGEAIDGSRAGQEEQ